MNQLKERLSHYLRALVDYPMLKVLGVETAILASTISEMRSAFLMLLFLNFVDLMTGLLVSLRFKKISSWGLRQSVLKIAVYFLLLFLGTMVKVSAHIEWVDSAFLGIIVTTEMISIIENIELFSPGLLPKPLLHHFGIVPKNKKKRKK